MIKICAKSVLHVKKFGRRRSVSIDRNELEYEICIDVNLCLMITQYKIILNQSITLYYQMSIPKILLFS